jgi:putative Mn2+ efflux pump MntP
MSIVVLLGIALALAMDAFAVSIGLGLSLHPATAAQTLRLAFHFGLFQFLMPVAGWAAGERLIGLIGPYDHWVAFGLLLVVGGKMTIESFRTGGEVRLERPDPTRGISLLVLSIATSLDALGVGISLAALGVAIQYPAIIIGLVAFVMTIVGMKLGPVLGRIIGRRAELLGGLVLILIGIRILVDHL